MITFEHYILNMLLSLNDAPGISQLDLVDILHRGLVGNTHIHFQTSFVVSAGQFCILKAY